MRLHEHPTAKSKRARLPRMSSAKSAWPKASPCGICNSSSPTDLALSRISDLHRPNFRAATVFVPFERMVVLVLNFDHLANLGLHTRHHLDLTPIGKCLGGRIIIPLDKHDGGAHVVKP